MCLDYGMDIRLIWSGSSFHKSFMWLRLNDLLQDGRRLQDLNDNLVKTSYGRVTSAFLLSKSMKKPKKQIRTESD